jgi:hypothetical protein
MCRIRDSSATVRKAAHDLAEALASPKDAGKSGNGMAQSLTLAFPVDLSLPDEFKGRLRQIGQPRPR